MLIALPATAVRVMSEIEDCMGMEPLAPANKACVFQSVWQDGEISALTPMTKTVYTACVEGCQRNPLVIPSGSQ
jgi:hypothetical protein